jgi:signal transduction histidine kinase
MSSIFKQTIDSLRDITYNLRPASLSELGIVNTLNQCCGEFQSNRRNVTFYTAGMQKIKMDFETEINLYRIVQEALNNVRKHAEASDIKVTLTASFPNIILQIEDNGKGFDVTTRKKEIIHEKRMGLKSIEERVGLLNGTFRIHSRPDVGTMLHVEVPYHPAWNAVS